MSGSGGENRDEQHAQQKGRGNRMNVQKALLLTFDEFVELANTCNGFNDEIYKNHQVHYEGESFGEFMAKGSARIKKDPILQGKLI